MIDLDALEELAKKATPGPWRTGWASGRCAVDHNNGRGGGHGGAQCRHVFTDWMDDEHHISRDPGYQPGDPWIGRNDVCGNYDYEEGGVIHGRDAAYIVAANPTTVLALIGRIRESEQEAADAWEIAKLNGAEGRRESERAERYRESLEAIAKPYPLGPTNALNSALNMQDTARNVLRDRAPAQ